MTTPTHKLAAGHTPADALDIIESQVISFMQAERGGIDEPTVRNLIRDDADACATYRHEFERAIQAQIARGLAPSVFGR
jgi:hypothetical protein